MRGPARLDRIGFGLGNGRRNGVHAAAPERTSSRPYAVNAGGGAACGRERIDYRCFPIGGDHSFVRVRDSQAAH